MFLPRSLSATMDARNSIRRLRPVFEAELVQEELIVIDRGQELAISVKGASFAWEEVLRGGEEIKGKDGKGGKKGNSSRKQSFDEAVKEPTPEKPFEMRDLNMEVKRGQLVAIVGRVGCGKVSSRLQLMLTGS
jgi:ATP-binding cassette, subfamily C (CFTR/MRP), member 1